MPKILTRTLQMRSPAILSMIGSRLARMFKDESDARRNFVQRRE